ncbi:MAG: T9SS type A sorting domain-containing protein [Bacteroidales bacterium]
MRKIFFVVCIVLASFESYSWQIYGPQDIEATNICFGPEYSMSEMICTTDGMYLFSEPNYDWEYHSFEGLPVQEGIFINAETIILVLGNGTDSDGIYSFNIPSGQFNPLAYCLYPKFIEYDDYAGNYYVGSEEGLLVSDNAVYWEEVSFFSGKKCWDMAISDTYLTITAESLPVHAFWSDNNGLTWNIGGSFFTQLAFYGNDLFGVYGGESFDSGLYKSSNGGNNWTVEFYSENLSDVCYDDYDGQLYVSWQYPFYSSLEGIAIYEPGNSYAGLTFLNEGLPNTSINRIAHKPGIDFFYVFVCTNTGVYSYIFVDVPEISSPNKIEVFPNPVKDNMHIQFSLGETTSNLSSIEIYNKQGVKVDEIKVESTFSSESDINWNKGKLSSGVYYLIIKTNKENFSKKFIIL